MLRTFESADRSFARPDNRRPLAASAPGTDLDMDCSDYWVTDSSDESVANSSDESDGVYAESSCKSDAESDVSDESLYNKLNTEGADDRMDKELEKMNQLVTPDLAAERERIERESDIQCLAGVSVSRFAEFLCQANYHMTEAHNVMSSGCLNPAITINQLPLECIIHVMHFISIQQVFVCMSVNKKWQEAARHTVRIHERLQLVTKRELEEGEIEIHRPLDLIIVNDSTDSDPLSESLLLMENLKQLKVHECQDFDLGKATKSVIVKNAASLNDLYTSLDLPSNSSPVIYQQLKKLDCILLSPWAECPVLEELIIYPCCDVEALSHLPILTMRKFRCRRSKEPDERTNLCSVHGDNVPFTFTQKVVRAAKRLVHLTHLTIHSDRWAPPCKDIETIMDDFTSLVVLELTLFDYEFEFDGKVDRLVRQNPHLKKLRLAGLRISVPALTCISRLPDLRSLVLYGHNVRFTMDGILTLLRRRLRHQLKFAVIGHVGISGDEKKTISDEIDLIAGERGKPLITIEQAEYPIKFQFED